MEASDHLMDKPTNIGIDDVPFKNVYEHDMVNTRKEFFDITLEYVAGTSMIVRYFASKHSEAVKYSMDPLVRTT